MFTSILRLDLIADAATRKLAEETLARREIFSPRSVAIDVDSRARSDTMSSRSALELISESEQLGGVPESLADEFIASCLETFAFNVESTVTREQYEQLRRVSPLVADICSFKTPHINREYCAQAGADVELTIRIQTSRLARSISTKFSSV